MYLHIHIPVSHIESYLNAFHQGILYDEAVEGDDGDAFLMRVNTESPYHVVTIRNLLRVKVPLAVEVTLKKDNQISRLIQTFSTHLKQTLLHFSVEMDIQIDVKENWNLSPRIQARFFWDKEPTQQIAGLKIRLTDWLTPFIERQLRQTSTQIEKNLAEAIPIRQIVTDIWTIFQKPLPIEKYPFIQIVLYPSPVQPIYALPVKVEAHSMDTVLSAPITPTIYVASSPVASEYMPLENYCPATVFPHISSVPFQISVSLDKIAAIFPSYDLVSEENNTRFNVRNIHVYTEKERAIFSGDIDGILSLWGFEFAIKDKVRISALPSWKQETQSIDLQDFDFDIQSDDFVLEWIENIGHSLLKKRIKKEMEQALDKLIVYIKQEVIDLLQHYEVHPTAVLTLKNQEISIHRFHIAEQVLWISGESSSAIKVTIGHFEHLFLE